MGRLGYSLYLQRFLYAAAFEARGFHRSWTASHRQGHLAVIVACMKSPRVRFICFPMGTTADVGVTKMMLRLGVLIRCVCRIGVKSSGDVAEPTMTTHRAEAQMEAMGTTCQRHSHSRYITPHPPITDWDCPFPAGLQWGRTYPHPSAEPEDHHV